MTIENLLLAVLIVLLVVFFFTSAQVRAARVCVSSQMVEIGQAPVINPMVCE